LDSTGDSTLDNAVSAKAAAISFLVAESKPSIEEARSRPSRPSPE